MTIFSLILMKEEIYGKSSNIYKIIINQDGNKKHFFKPFKL